MIKYFFSFYPKDRESVIALTMVRFPPWLAVTRERKEEEGEGEGERDMRCSLHYTKTVLVYVPLQVYTICLLIRPC